MNKTYELNNKVALITGGGSGIGLGIASHFISLGAKVAITGRNMSKLQNAKLALGENCFIYGNDITQKDLHETLVVTIEKEIGPIEILVNNAGIHQKKASMEVTDAEFQMVMDTNINSVFALTRTVLKHMMPRGKGSVISISSMAAIFGITQVVAYSSAKTALLGMTRSLASEYSHTGVRFNAIAPGFIETKMFLDIMEKDPMRKEKILSRTPARRFGTVEDVAYAAAFLASDGSSFITGVCLPVDGGNSIGF
jgi:NAD(P)-dependent dehydrogenase (short-subunit alcohol dehydrogenase family)